MLHFLSLWQEKIWKSGSRAAAPCVSVSKLFMSGVRLAAYSQHVPPVGCGFSSCIQGGIPKDPVRYSEINAHNPADGRERGVTIL